MVVPVMVMVMVIVVVVVVVVVVHMSDKPSVVCTGRYAPLA
jgi:hypothetical protein